MVSFIVPVYNTETYLEACVGSLTAQGESEIILVDDGSTDGSLSIARRLAGINPCIRLYEQAHAGQSAARNTGLVHANGEYIAFVDADDRLEPDWLAQHLEAIEGADYVQSGYKRCKGTILKEQRARGKYRFTSPCMRLYRREAIEGMRFEEGMIYEDVIWSVDLWLRSKRCRMTDNTGYLYTANPESTTSSPHPDAQRTVFRKLRERAAHASFRGKCIILYTIIRLKLHFLKQ